MYNKIVFGTDGWRGLLDIEVNQETVREVAQAFALYLQNKFIEKSIQVAVGFDGRRFSKEFAQLFAEVLSGNNINVFLSDKVIPTPVLSFFVKNYNLNAGVMITASHNPANYNGIKFKADYGGPFLTEETHKVEKLLGNKIAVLNDNLITVTDLLLPYYNHIETLIDFPLIQKSELKILVDSMAGAGQKIIENIFKKHNIEADTIFGTAEFDFAGRNAEPIEQNLYPLKEYLSNKKKYSIGLATDGDADRLGVLLENGEWLSAQETILLLTDYLKNKRNLKGNIVKTSSVTDIIREYFEKEDCKVIDVQVGFKYITEEMLKGNIAIGFEESGGYGYGNHIPERDGILSGLIIAEMLAASGFNKLSEYINEKRNIYGNIFYKRIDYHYDRNDRIEKLPQIINNILVELNGYKIVKTESFLSSRDIINGLKIFFEGSRKWLLLRSSETEPMFRIYAEGENEQDVINLLEAGKNLISK